LYEEKLNKEDENEDALYSILENDIRLSPVELKLVGELEIKQDKYFGIYFLVFANIFRKLRYSF
jgi:hypothetical protein